MSTERGEFCLEVVEDQVGIPPGHLQHEDHRELAVADLQDVLDGDLGREDQLLETLSELVLDLHSRRIGFVVLVLSRQLQNKTKYKKPAVSNLR